MKIGVSCGVRYYRVGEQYYTSTSYHADMWKECLEVFDEVIITDRVIYSDKIEPGFKPTVLEGIRFLEYPNFEGVWALLKVLPQMFWRARKYARQVDVWHFHCVHFETFCTWLWAYFYRVPYALELRGDQDWTSTYLKLRGVKFPRLVRAVMWRIMALQLTKPVAAVGVSKSLIREYPPRNNCPTFVISDSRIPEQLYGEKRSWKGNSACRTIICVGRCEAQKNPPGTMRALAKLDQKGFTNWKFVWVGSGNFKEKTSRQADELGLSDRVTFLGYVPWDDVFKLLHTADLFLLNSLSEGMPRAMIEAIACALPVIGTNIGGVSELLHPDDIVEPMQDDMLADKLYEVLTDTERLTKMSRRNLETAKGYSKEILRAKKVAFYAELRTIAAGLKEKKKDCSKVTGQYLRK